MCKKKQETHLTKITLIIIKIFLMFNCKEECISWNYRTVRTCSDRIVGNSHTKEAYIKAFRLETIITTQYLYRTLQLENIFHINSLIVFSLYLQKA